jgi:serine/threonine protein kinase
MSSKDMARLCVWNSIGDSELEGIFSESGNGGSDEQRNAAEELIRWQRSAAKELIRWCLQGDPAKRPSVEEVCKHRFFDQTIKATVQPQEKEESLRSAIASCQDPIKSRSLLRPVYHVFISYAQREASGDVGTLRHLLEQLGLRTWRDMNADDLTEKGDPTSSSCTCRCTLAFWFLVS